MSNDTGIFGVNHGIICQQCNCRGAYGAGLSGAIADKYPEVLKLFNADYDLNEGQQFGTYRIIPVEFTHTDSGVKALSIANIYSQDDYGNSAVTKKKYTDTDKLVSAIKDICERSDCNVYIPHSVDKKGNHSGIGCGLAGEKWENLYPRLQALNAPNLYLLDTFTGEIEKVQPTGKEQQKPKHQHKKSCDIER